jgi:hypothetical protein
MLSRYSSEHTFSRKVGMPLSVAQLTQHFAQKPGRSALLGCLALTLVVLMGRALVKTRPAAALPNPEATVASVSTPVDGLSPDELSRRLENSSELWKVLHQVRGMPANSVFKLSPHYYESANPEPAPAAAPAVVQVQRVDPNIQAQVQRRAVEAAAAELQLRSVVLAQDPVAVINAQMVRVGDVIGGFKIIAIQARQVVVEKDGTSVVLNMVR